MDKKSNKVGEKEKPNWDWTHVECYLKTVEASRKSTIWNLSPSIILTNPSTENSGPSVRLYIDTEKSLQYSNELGWNWHKSWNIPNISLRLEIKDDNTGDFLLAPRNLYAQIFAVKKNPESQKLQRMTLIDVGIRGESKMEMIDGQVYFSAIKFSSTTYNNEGVNFNLLIVLYINEGEFEKPKVLTAVLSPPIFVDSRRSARDYQEKKFSSFVEPFSYDTIEKEFIKRENKSKCESEIIIKNDPEGFYNYITAPNIRHKVKHPVFLAIKFSNCVTIFHNQKLVEAASINELLQSLQTRLLKENKTKQKTDIELATNLDEKHFVFVIVNLTDSLKRKKVIQSIETMQNEFIGIACGIEDLPDCLQPLGQIEQVKKAYKESYEALVTICQNYEPEQQDESDDEYYSEQYDQSEKSSKKKKEDPKPRNKTTIISNKNTPQVTPPPEKQPERVPQTKVEKNDEIVLKKEQLFDSQFQAPVFFNQEQERKPSIAASAFSKAVGFRNVTSGGENHPIFDTSQLNKAFSSNVEFPEPPRAPFKANKTESNVLINQAPQSQPQAPHPQIPQQMNSGMQGNQQSQGFGMTPNYGNGPYENLLYGNMNNWVSTVKSNNNGLYDGMGNHSMPDQMMHKNNLERYLQNQQQQKMVQLGRMNQNDDQQSVVCLMQQIQLYKELLAQVTYQNQLLSRDITIKQSPMGSFGGMPPMNYHMPQHQQMSMNYNPMSNHHMMMGMNPHLSRPSDKDQMPQNPREATVMPSKQNSGIPTNNYQIIKNMVLEEIKREAEQKERERQDSK